MTDTCEMRELTDMELDAVCGGWGWFNDSFNTVTQGNLQVGVIVGGGGNTLTQLASNISII